MRYEAASSVVIIDDKEEDCESIRCALADLMDVLHVSIFNTGRKALDALVRSTDNTSGQCSRPPDLIILDFDLPRMRAPEVVAALRANPVMHLVPIVIFSDSRATRDIKDSYESGANGFVCKPVDFEEFQDTVRTVGRYWLEINKHPP